MAWNEPGKNHDNDPWGNKEGPPDLDDVFKDVKKRLSGLFGTGGSKGGANATAANDGPPLKIIFSLIALIYVLSGIYIVQPAERGVVTRFGAYVRTTEPGPHWYPRFIESAQVVNIEQVLTSQHAELMLTKDENIVRVEIAVQYYIGNVRDYLFNIVEPNYSLKQVSDSALRYVIGHSTLEEILTSGRAAIATQISHQITENLNNYQSGIIVADVAMQPARAPDEVKDAFDDAIRAQEDEFRSINQADGYRRRILPIAEGKSRRMLEEAEAYKQQRVLLAQGDVARFDALLPEYNKAKTVTRSRMYIDTMEGILAKNPKVILDAEPGQFMVLPLEKLMGRDKSTSIASELMNVKEALSDFDKASSDDKNTQERSYVSAARERTGRGRE